MDRWSFVERDETVLACRNFGGVGPDALLLHGLAGHAGEWTETAHWLTARRRVLGSDARGHGRSDRIPTDVSRDAHVKDAIYLIERLASGPVVLIGQSLGGHTAVLVATQRPDVVEGLIVADASPAERNEATVAELRTALAAWPVPFPSREGAIGFFGGPSLTADAWVDGLEERANGWWPRFDVDMMVETLRRAVSRSYWEEWEQIQCPTLVVRAGNGVIPVTEADAMRDRLPQADVIENPGAKHDLHLDRSAEWRTEVCRSLDSLEPPT